jgi:GMP synthase-like glutamine amidotransferase
MKILLVNNNSKHLQKVKDSLLGDEVIVQNYTPGIKFQDKNVDLIILSGGQYKEMHDMHGSQLWYQDEMELVMSTKKPLIGICMGFEVIAAAYGSKIKANPDPSYEVFLTKKTTPRGMDLFKREELKQFSAHHWCVQDIPSKYFQVLADSENCIEMIRHKTRPIIATQFHPEIPGGTLQLSELFIH